MKLKTVQVSFEYIMAVEDDATSQDVINEAADTLHAAVDDMSIQEFSIQVLSLLPSNMPPGWNEQCLPYGGDGYTTIKEILISNGYVRDYK